MRIFTLNQKSPLHFLVCGNLISEDGFLHIRRNFQDNVLILVQKGTLYINSNGKDFSLTENQFIFLKAGEEHFGFRKSEGFLSYYWLHFKTDTAFDLINSVNMSENSDKNPLKSSDFVIPEAGNLLNSAKINLLFRQLMDFSLEDSFYNKSILDYLCSAVVMELSSQFLQNTSSKTASPLVFQITSWIKQNFTRQFTIAELSRITGYQSDYLAKVFHQITNQTISQYTNHLRVENARKLLPNFTIKETAYSCGFEDEKYFMKVFKKEVGLTPGQFQTAFFKKNVNRE